MLKCHLFVFDFDWADGDAKVDGLTIGDTAKSLRPFIRERRSKELN